LTTPCGCWCCPTRPAPSPTYTFAEAKLSQWRAMCPAILRRWGSFEARGAGEWCEGEGQGRLSVVLPTPADGSAMERGQKIAKTFGTLGKRLGINEIETGARRANTDLRSLRRSAIASMCSALNEGATGFTMRTIPGQRLRGRSADLYPCGASTHAEGLPKGWPSFLQSVADGSKSSRQVELLSVQYKASHSGWAVRL
jgi:hypothetical protein